MSLQKYIWKIKIFFQCLNFFLNLKKEKIKFNYKILLYSLSFFFKKILGGDLNFFVL